MAESKKRIGKETASIGLRLPQFVGYSDYFYETPLYVQIKNLSGESAPFSVSVTGGELLVPFEEEAEVPFESAVELTAEGVFSPVFLSQREELRQAEVVAVLSYNKKELVRTSMNVTVLPYDWWEGLSGNAERLAGFVRPNGSRGSCAPNSPTARACCRRRANASKSGRKAPNFMAMRARIKTPCVVPLPPCLPPSAARTSKRTARRT